MNTKSFSTLDFAAVVAACGTQPIQSDPWLDDPVIVVRAATGDTIRLRLGQTAEVDVGADRVRIAFDGVTEDSRCPHGVDCVWSGDAAASVRLSAPGTAAITADLHTHIEPRRVEYAGRVVLLLDVEPYPRYGGSIAQDEYVAVLRVTGDPS